MTARITSSDPATWLLGTWRSDKERTLATYSWPSAKARASFGRDLGKLVHRYTPKRVQTSWDGEVVDRLAYRVVWKSDSEVFLVFGRGSRETGTHIRFLSPTEYLAPMGKGGGEYFRKIPSEGEEVALDV